MYNIQAANENKGRPQAAIGSERAARLALIENLDHGRTAAPQDNLGINVGLVDCWPNSGGGITAAPPRALATMGSARVAHLDALGNLYPRENFAEIKSIRKLRSQEGPEATMYKAPVADENMRRPLAAIGSERAARLAVIQNRDPGHNLNRNVQQANCWPNSGEGWTPARGVPHPDRNPLPTPTPKATLTTGPDGLYLLFDKTPVQAESSWLSMLSELKEKAESNPLPELPLTLNDERELDDLHYVQAKNHRLAEHILSQMPNEQSRHRFQHELLRRQLRSEQQLTNFLETKLSQVSIAPESQSHWMSWFGNGEDTVAAGGEGGGKNVE